MFFDILNNFFINNHVLSMALFAFTDIILVLSKVFYLFDFPIKLNMVMVFNIFMLICIFLPVLKIYVLSYLICCIIFTIITDYIALKTGRFMWKLILWLICPILCFILIKTFFIPFLPNFISCILIALIVIYLIYILYAVKRVNKENPDLAYYILPIFLNTYYVGLKEDLPDIPFENPDNKKEIFDNMKYSVQQLDLVISKFKPNKIYMIDTNASVREKIINLSNKGKLKYISYFHYTLFALFKNEKTARKFFGNNADVYKFIKNPKYLYYYRFKWLS